MPLALDQLRRDLAPIVRAIVADVRRGVTDAVVVARGVQRIEVLIEGDDERPAERCRRENAEGLRVIAELGNVRGAALKAAQRAYPNNPSEHYRLAQRFRRILRQQ